VSGSNLPPSMCVACGESTGLAWEALCQRCWDKTPRAMVRAHERAKSPTAKREAAMRICKHLGIDAPDENLARACCEVRNW